MRKIKNYFIAFWSQKDAITSETWRSIAFNIFPIVIIHFVLEKGFSRVATIPINSYYNYSIFLEVLKKCLTSWYVVIPLLVAIIIYKKGLLASWTSFEKGKSIRLLILITTIILTWFYSTYDYNFYFNQSHIIDRVLLIVFVLAIYWRPIFLIPYILLLFAILWQFESLPGYSTGASPFLLTRIIILFIASFIFKLVFKRFQFSTFIFLLGCLISSHYFTSGFVKLSSQWIFNDQLNFLLPATYANGWLSFLDQESISTFTKFLGWLNGPLRFFTILVECGILFFFFNLNWARFLMKCAILMHIGIFIYSGIFFWMWISILITVLFIYRESKLDVKRIFNKKYFIISIVLIFSGKFWSSVGGISWHDSPVSYSYRIYALTEDGEQHRLPANFFSCYDFQFAATNFKYLSPDPRLNVLWGATGSKVASYFNTEKSLNDVFEFEKEQGSVYEDLESQKRFKAFITQYITNWNTHVKDKNYLNYIKAPPLYWTFPYRTFSEGKKKISSIIIKEVTTFYSDKSGYKEIRNNEILHLKIDLEQSK